jgi:hypothetical protein
MLIGQHAHRRVETLIGERQPLGHGGQAWAAPGGRCARITADGSTATTLRPGGSYEPVPAPALPAARALLGAAQVGAAIRGSVRRPAA